MDLDLPYGPWNKVFSAEWNGKPFTVYRNKPNELLIILFIKEKNKISNMLISLKRIFLVEGNLDKFLMMQKQPLVAVEKSSANFKARYLVVTTTPQKIPYSFDDLSNTLHKQHSNLDVTSDLIKQALHTYDITVIDFDKVNERYILNFFSDPLTLFTMSSEKGGATSSLPELQEVLIGANRWKQPVKAKLSSFSKIEVIGESEAKRKHVLHILIESVLLNNIPAFIFDTSGSFSGISLANRNTSEFEDFGMNALPIGFPTKKLKPEEGLFVDLKLLKPEIFIESFGLEKGDVAKLLSKTLSEQKNVSTLGEIVTYLSSLKPSREFPAFIIEKTIRVLEVIQKSFPSLFEKNTLPELVEPWKQPIGSAYYVNLKGTHPMVKNLVISYMLSSLKSASDNALKLLVVFDEPYINIPKNIRELLNENVKFGVAFGVHASEALDLADIDSPTLVIDLIGEECVVTETGEPQRRFVIRPAYSHCSEK